MNDSQAALSQGFHLRDMLISMPFFVEQIRVVPAGTL
jgi:hypothetical protein